MTTQTNYTGKTHNYAKKNEPRAHVDLWGAQMVTRKNMMSGKEYQERRDTPCYLSPACESYWSM